jgi:TPR repeat protein/CHAD domain-containing protein
MPSSYAGMNIEQLRLCAKEGDTEAQFLLGVRLLSVRGGAMEGTEHLKEAAKKRHLQACERLGSVYLYGEGGVPQDKKQAMVYYEQAFALGSVTARTRLTDLYLEDEEKAARGLKLLTDMADAGDKAAATRAAKLFLSGEVSGVDFERAAKYAGLSDDSAVLYEAAEKLDTLGVDPELRDELYRKLIEKDQKGAHLGISALITIGRMYMLGKGVKPDGRSAERLLKRAVDLEGQQAVTEPRAELALAELYEQGAAGLPADHEAARRLLRALAKEGSEVARVRYVKLCTQDGRYLDAYRAHAEARKYGDALGYVLNLWENIPDQAEFVRRAFLFAEPTQKELPGLRALRDELYRRQLLAGAPADQVLAYALEKGDAQGALTFFEGLSDADKSLIYQNAELCASVPPAQPGEPDAYARLRALLGEVPEEIRRWDETMLRLRACYTDRQRWDFARETLPGLPPLRAGEPRQLTALREALASVREPEPADPYQAMRTHLQDLRDAAARSRYAQEVLPSLPKAQAGEAEQLTELREELLQAREEEAAGAYSAMLAHLHGLRDVASRARYAEEVLPSLPKAQAGEAEQLTELREELLQAREEGAESAYSAMLAHLGGLRDAAARARYAQEVLPGLPQARAGEARQLTELREALGRETGAAASDEVEAGARYAKMLANFRGLPAGARAQYAEKVLPVLLPKRSGEPAQLTMLREELRKARGEEAEEARPGEQEEAYPAMLSRFRRLPRVGGARARYAGEIAPLLPPERAGEPAELTELRREVERARGEAAEAPRAGQPGESTYRAMLARFQALPLKGEERAQCAEEIAPLLPPEHAGEPAELTELRGEVERARGEAAQAYHAASDGGQEEAYPAMLSHFRRLPRLGGARVQYAQETLPGLPAEAAGEEPALTRLRSELSACLAAHREAQGEAEEDAVTRALPKRQGADAARLREGLKKREKEPAKALRYAIDTLLELGKQGGGEDGELGALCGEMREYLRRRWGAFAEAFEKKSGDNPKDVGQARYFIAQYLEPARPLYEDAPCREYDAVRAAAARLLSKQEAKKEGAPAREGTDWARKLQAFQPDPQDTSRLPAVARALAALPPAKKGEDEDLAAYRAALGKEQGEIVANLEEALAACATAASRRRFAAENKGIAFFSLPGNAPVGPEIAELRRRITDAASARDTVWEERLEKVQLAASEAERVKLLGSLAGQLPKPRQGEEPALAQLRELCAGLEWKQRLEAFNQLTDEAKKSAFARGPLGVLPPKQKGEDATLSILRSLLTPYQAGNDVKPPQAVNVSQEEEGWTEAPLPPPKKRKRGCVGRAVLAVLLIAAIGACGVFIWRKIVGIPAPGTPQSSTQPSGTGEAEPTPFRATRLTQLQPVEAPSRYYIDRWTNTAYTGDFMALVGDEARQVSGIGWFVPSSAIDSKEEGAQGQVKAVYDLGGQYKKLTFLLSADQVWTDGAAAGTYNLTVACDGETVYDSGWCDHLTSQTGIEVDLTGCGELTFTLTQRRGVKGTLNIVMGELALE